MFPRSFCLVCILCKITQLEKIAYMKVNMCFDSDLFGDVIVTINDVNLWLDTVADLKGASNSRRNYYAKFNDVASKIKLSKLNNSFTKLITSQNDEPAPLDFFAIQYVKNSDEKKPACPSWFHFCDNLECDIYKKRIISENKRAIYQSRKCKAINRF